MPARATADASIDQARHFAACGAMELAYRAMALALWMGLGDGDPVTIDRARTAVQVDKNAGLRTDELVEQVRRLAPRAFRARRSAPALIRRQTMPDGDGR